jgi:syntaxin 18
MDVSLFFHCCVKQALEYNQVFEQPIKSNIISKFRQKQHLFINKAYSITQQIAKLYELLASNHIGYLNFSQYLSTETCKANGDNDEIHSLAQNIITTCSKLISDLKSEILISRVSQQNQEHREAIILLIEEYLKEICKFYVEQKSKQIKKNIKVRNISKLKPIPNEKEKLVQKNTSRLNINTSEEKTCVNEEESLKIQEINGDIIGFSSECDQLSTEDIQIFEAENEQLYNDLNILSDEIKQIENKVVQITELQNIFSEKILHQDKNLERVLVTLVGSTENVREANEQIRNAIQRNAGLRVWILFFLLVMSLTLIFLDWYNP